MFYSHLKAHIEAILFAAGDPIKAEKLAEILDIPLEHVKELLLQLTQDMAAPERGLCLLQIGGGYQICTKPEFAAIVEKLAAVQDTRLSNPALEALAIVAFKQPVTRQEVDFIRGVQSDSVINTLVERRLIREVGRKDAVGRPILYGTTDEFMACFGINSLDELPKLPDPEVPDIPETNELEPEKTPEGNNGASA